MIKKKLQGFTLIELMVVITIIGILAIIVLPNLTTVRGRGQDAAIKEQMTQFRATAELFYGEQYGYTTNSPTHAVVSLGSCLGTMPTASVFSTSDAVRVMTGISANASTPPNCYLGIAGTKSQTWAITAKMRTSTGYWCVDSAGNSKALITDSAVIGSEAICP